MANNTIIKQRGSIAAATQLANNAAKQLAAIAAKVARLPSEDRALYYAELEAKAKLKKERWEAHCLKFNLPFNKYK